jgi:hypothetical protein
MQELNWTGAEINRLFSHENRLDRKDMVCNFFSTKFFCGTTFLAT